MRILAGFASLVFLFVNPAMFIQVLGCFESLIHGEVRIGDLLAADQFAPRHAIHLANLCLMSLLIVVHIVLTGLHAYGCFTGRPAYIRPMVVDCIASTVLLSIFLILSTLAVLLRDDAKKEEAREDKLTENKNLTIGGVFLIVYMAWVGMTLYTYFDIKQMHEDFMYWIVEERNSQRKGSLRLSTDRSGGSSKSSKGSKNSTKSSKLEEHSRPNSAAASIPSKKTSLANNRLSVPL